MAPPKKKTKSTPLLQKSIRKTAFKPCGRTSARFVVKSIQTKVPEIIVTYCYRSSDEGTGAYLKPMIDAYANDVSSGGPIPQLFNIQYVSMRRAGAVNVAKKVSNDSNYEWECLVTVNDDEDVSPLDIAENLANRFSSFKAENYESQSFRAETATSEEEDMPVNAYLLDWDACVLLRMIYSDSSKEQLMSDDDIMEMFFGSPDAGRSILNAVSTLKWNSVF